MNTNCIMFYTFIYFPFLVRDLSSKAFNNSWYFGPCPLHLRYIYAQYIYYVYIYTHIYMISVLCNWLTSVIIVDCNMDHFVANGNISLFLLLSIPYSKCTILYNTFFIHSSVNGYQVCFHILAIVNILKNTSCCRKLSQAQISF